jgi:tetratricopeptide (TPR) repeat protein
MSEAPLGGQDSRQEENPRPPDHNLAPNGDAYTWYQRGLELLGRGSAAAAAQLLERAAQAEPGSRMVREALARAQFDAGRYGLAAENFRMIVEASPSDDYAHFGLGLALARIGHHAAAAEYLALAAAMRPDARHYTDALRSVRATLRAQDNARQPRRDASTQPRSDACTQPDAATDDSR